MIRPLASCALLLALAGGVRAEDEPAADPKPGPHETLREALVAAWQAQGDLDLRYRFEPEGGGVSGNTIDVRRRRDHLLVYMQPIPAPGSEEAPEEPSRILAVTPRRMADLRQDDRGNVVAMGVGAANARRARLRAAWARAMSALGRVVEGAPWEPAYGAALTLGFEAAEDARGSLQVGLDVRVGAPAPSWLSTGTWEGAKPTSEEGGATVRLEHADGTLRIERATGVLLEATHRHAGRTAARLRSVGSSLGDATWREFRTYVHLADTNMAGAGLDRQLYARDLAELLVEVSALPEAVRAREDLDALLVGPMLAAAHEDELFQGQAAVLFRELMRDVEDAGVPPASVRDGLAMRAATMCMTEIDLVLRDRPADRRPVLGSERARLAVALESWWARRLDAMGQAERVRDELVARLAAAPPRTAAYRWRVTEGEADPGDLRIALRFGAEASAATWTGPDGLPLGACVTATRSVFHDDPAEDPVVAPGTAWFAALHARRLALVEASRERAEEPLGVRAGLDTPAFIVVPIAGDFALRPWLQIGVGARGAPGWLQRGLWASVERLRLHPEAIGITDAHTRMRVSRRTGLPLAGEAWGPAGRARYDRLEGDEASKAASEALAAWIRRCEALEPNEAGWDWAHRQTRDGAAVVCAAVCGGAWAEADPRERKATAHGAVMAMVSPAYVDWFAGAWIARADDLARRCNALPPAEREQVTAEGVVDEVVLPNLREYLEASLGFVLEMAEGPVRRRDPEAWDQAMADAILEAGAQGLTTRVRAPLIAALRERGLR